MPVVDSAGGDAGIGIAYVGPFAQRHPGVGGSDVFAASALAAGDLIVLQIDCAGGAAPSAASVTAPGWTFTADGPIFTNTAAGYYTASYHALAPDTAATTITVTWTGGTCPTGKGELGDEFTHADPMLPVDRVVTDSGTGDCMAQITTTYANEAIWAACFSATTLVAPGAGYTMGADDGGGDWAEYKLTMDPAGTNELATYTNSNVAYTFSTFAIKPR